MTTTAPRTTASAVTGAPRHDGTMLYRGEHKLPHQAQATGRDLTAEDISNHLGAAVYGYRRTAAQVRACHAGEPGTGLPYEYLLHSPRSRALSWHGFYTREDLRLWMLAYGVRLESQTPSEPTPGDAFALRLPSTPEAFAPLEVRHPRAQPPLPR